MEEGSPESIAVGEAIASGLAMAKVLSFLIEKKVLNVGEVRGLLQQTQNDLVSDDLYQTVLGREAGRAINDLLKLFL